VVPAAVLARIHALDTFIAANATSARAFLAAAGHPKPMREIAIAELDEHTSDARIPELLAPVRAGTDAGLLSEAGAPAVADPGARLVAQAHAEGIRVVPMVGPSAILLGLMASGLEGQRFRFHGYLPAQSPARRARLAEIERLSARYAETQVFIETPYRNDALIGDIIAACRDDTRIAIAASLTGEDESIRAACVRDWRTRPPLVGKRPAVFLLLAAPRGRPAT
jgi:16S rRNA (cytidine1402-2'-O)-methyltransferase